MLILQPHPTPPISVRSVRHLVLRPRSRRRGPPRTSRPSNEPCRSGCCGTGYGGGEAARWRGIERVRPGAPRRHRVADHRAPRVAAVATRRRRVADAHARRWGLGHAARCLTRSNSGTPGAEVGAVFPRGRTPGGLSAVQQCLDAPSRSGNCNGGSSGRNRERNGVPDRTHLAARVVHALGISPRCPSDSSSADGARSHPSRARPWMADRPDRRAEHSTRGRVRGSRTDSGRQHRANPGFGIRHLPRFRTSTFAAALAPHHQWTTRPGPWRC